MRRYLSGKVRPIPPKIILLGLIVVFAGLAGWFLMAQRQKTPIIKNYQDCVDAGNPILESYPKQCIHNGRSYLNPAQKAEEPI